MIKKVLIILVVLVAILLVIIIKVFNGSLDPFRIRDKYQSEERLDKLRTDYMYSVHYPNSTELRRVERGSQGFIEGIESEPTIMYYAGTTASDNEIMIFFVKNATTHGWSIFREPAWVSNAEKISVIFRKEGVGWLIVRLSEPETLNRLLLYEKLPINGYSTIIWVTLNAENLE